MSDGLMVEFWTKYWVTVSK